MFFFHNINMLSLLKKKKLDCPRRQNKCYQPYMFNLRQVHENKQHVSGCVVLWLPARPCPAAASTARAAAAGARRCPRRRSAPRPAARRRRPARRPRAPRAAPSPPSRPGASSSGSARRSGRGLRGTTDIQTNRWVLYKHS